MTHPPITPLTQADHDQAIEVLAAAFAQHPMLPPDPPGKPPNHNAKRMMETMIEIFAKAPNAQLLGTRIDDQLACVAFVHEYGYEPKGFDLVKLLWSMTRIMGIGKLFAMMDILNEKHSGDDRKLELLILGTREGFQQRGLGRAMIRHINTLAQQEGYAAVTLEAAQETPAFSFYQREGFVVEKQLSLAGQPLCFMRCDVLPNATSSR